MTVSTPETERAVNIRALVIAITFVVMPIAGLAGGLWLPSAIRRGAFENWKSLGTPPVKASAILAADARAVYVGVQDGRRFGCTPAEPESCWLEAPAAPPGRNPAPCPTPLRMLVSEMEDVTFVDQREVEVCSANPPYEVRYAVDDEGAVWSWQHALAPAGPLDFVWGPVGAFVGLIDAAVTAVVLRRGRWRLQ
jgi:hypothetical protein